jgi:3-oxoacyl-[acyl-carrier-protein] synthase III
MHQISQAVEISPPSFTAPSAAVYPAVVRPQPAIEKKPSGVFTPHSRTHTLLGVQVAATGSHVPSQIVTNRDLEEQYGIDPGWVEQRTGILERRYAADGEATSHLCVEAARRAMRAARVSPADVDLIVVGTFTPDYMCPSTACLVQDALGIDAPAMDVQAACSGFLYALVTATQFVASGNSRMALVLGADVNSRIVDPNDKKIAPLFGDGAGAVLLAPGDPHQGLMCYQLGSDGSGGGLLDRPAGGSLNPCTADDLKAGRQFLRMDGRNVFKWAVRALTDTIDLVLSRTGMSTRDVSLFFVHQANIRIIDYAMEQLGIPADKVVNNLHRYGNTSAASIPLALDEAHREGRLHRGDTVLLSGFGAGLTWGTGLFRW